MSNTACATEHAARMRCRAHRESEQSTGAAANEPALCLCIGGLESGKAIVPETYFGRDLQSLDLAQRTPATDTPLCEEAGLDPLTYMQGAPWASILLEDFRFRKPAGSFHPLCPSREHRLISRPQLHHFFRRDCTLAPIFEPRSFHSASRAGLLVQQVG
ncbi:hypothetical protein AAL_02769 [Moelleriella libera RCEF 2490]|uniref:Uncharacterized protein n=1 Tax=Moelleriella libera RCEF 2490 TaxID=1081109 RepID=A0A168EWI1_9HYPO|nr:hypothetical protein AAL_02769 [Moelleriella libera RCEF 2490]